MKNRYLIVLASFLAFACSKKEGELIEKKAQLAEYKKEATELNKKIAELEKEVATLDPTVNAAERQVLITTLPVSRKEFAHFVEVRGSVESNQNITISAENPGVIERIPAEEGEVIKKGQLLMQQNNEVLQRNVAEVKTQLDLASTLYNKQANLWKQGIGTEMQYLQAKNNKESLENRLNTLQAQLAKTTVRAPFSGVVDDIMVREGENALPGTPLVRVVNLDQVYVEADVSEEYLGRIKKGDEVIVQIPSLNTEQKGKIRTVSQVIKPDNRTFRVEVALDNKDNQLRPKMLAVLKINDFKKENAIVIPTNLIQQDKDEEFVFVVSNNGGKTRAAKVQVERGQTYNNETLIKKGLTGDEKLIKEGFREVSDSTVVKITQVQ